MIKEEHQIQIANKLEEIEAKIRCGEVASIIVLANCGKETLYIACGNDEDLAISMAHLYDEPRFFKITIKAISIVGLNNLKNK